MITVGYVQTAVNVSEREGIAQLSVAILMPSGTDPIETSFYLLVNTLDGAALAVDLPGLPLNLFIPINYSDMQSLLTKY